MSHLKLEISDELARRLREEASRLNKSTEDRVREILEVSVAPAENLQPEVISEGLSQLRSFLGQIPAVTVNAVSRKSEPYWWFKFSIDIGSPIAWHVVQELGFVLNYISITERLPTVFKPVSPPPYLNGGPKDFLGWVIEAEIPFLDARHIAGVLKSRLPEPVGDIAAWLAYDAEEDT